MYEISHVTGYFMDEVKRILAALAFSDYAEGIFNYAGKLATAFNSELIVANVINSRDVNAVETVSTMGYDIDGSQYVENVKKGRKKVLAEYMKASTLSPDRIRTIFCVGNPIEELLRITLEEEVDMIVMGTKGRTSLRKVLVGSVAEGLFRQSPVTIVSYRDEKSAERLRNQIHMSG